MRPGVLWLPITVLLATAGVVLLFGTLLTREADRLADRTGLGEAIFGAVLLGGSTSIAGIVTSVATAWQGFPELAAANAIGGIAVQTAFLGVADLTYRRANLEHAAASVENLVQGALLATLLAMPLAAAALPAFTWWNIHPVSIAIFAMYLFGLHLVRGARQSQLWTPRTTTETVVDEPDTRSPSRTGAMWSRFVLYGLITAGAGYAVARSGIALVRDFGFQEGLVGGYLTAVITSLPELVVAVAAVRRGALTLAVGSIIGGNAFDVLFFAAADVAFVGSLYHAMAAAQVFLISLTLVMTGVLLLGLLRRERSGVGGIGFESFLILVLYVGAAVLLFLL